MTRRSNSPGQRPPAQGEGDYQAARRYDAAQQAFVRSGRNERAARDAAPSGPQEAAELERAQASAASHAKDEDPAVAAGSGGSRQRARSGRTKRSGV